MSRRSKVELFEEIRREYEDGAGTIKGVADKLGVHRRMVREALANAVPLERKKAVRERPKISSVESFVEAILESDKRAPRKQRHTAHRIWCRLREEMPDLKISESTVRRYVRERKEELGLSGREVFIQQSCDWGVEAQIDWYEAKAHLDGEARNLFMFCMRGMAVEGPSTGPIRMRASRPSSRPTNWPSGILAEYYRDSHAGTRAWVASTGGGSGAGAGAALL